MDAAAIKLHVDQSMLAADEDRLPDAEAQLNDLIQQIGIPQTPILKNALCQCLIGRATVLRFANRWQGAIDDLNHCEEIALTLSALPRVANLHSVYLIRAKLFATPFIPVYNPQLALKTIGQLRQLGFEDWAAVEIESELAYRSREWKQAAQAALHVAQTLEALGWHAGAMKSRLRAGKALIELGDWQAAEKELVPAQQFFEQFGPPDQLASTQMALARLELARSHTDLAWEYANLALLGIERLIRNFKALFDQQLFILDKVEYYQHAFTIGLAKGGKEGVLRAWAIAERAKSFYLCQIMANSDITIFDGVSEEQIARLHDLERRLDRCESNLDLQKKQALDLNRQTSLEKQYQSLTETHAQMLETIMRSNPRWAALRSPPTFDLETELRRLAPEWIPLSYFWQEQENGATLHILYQGPDHEPQHLTTVWTSTDLERLDQCRAELTGAVRVNAQLFPADLIERVFPPELGAQLVSGRSLLISPHGRLQALPLHALAFPSGERLITRLPVQYLPTFALLPLQTARSRPSGVLLMGCEQDGFGDAPLEDVPDEIQKLTGLWSACRPGEVTGRLIPPDGSPTQAGMPIETWDGYEYIHIACHGVFPEGQPLQAALRLGQDALRASEFFTTRLNASLVSLSACALGRQAHRSTGMDLRGDEWIGLYLPMFYAGAQTLLVSLWDADSETAVSFMGGLHSALSREASPAQAFQSAHRSVIRRPAPLWANWYMVGFPNRPNNS